MAKVAESLQTRSLLRAFSDAFAAIMSNSKRKRNFDEMKQTANDEHDTSIYKYFHSITEQNGEYGDFTEIVICRLEHLKLKRWIVYNIYIYKSLDPE